MSTYEALRFFGLDYYATALDIKAAYRRFATALRPDSVIGDPKSVSAAEERLRMLNRAYEALQNRVGHTPPGIDMLPGVENGSRSNVQTSRLQVLTARAGVLRDRVRQNWKLAGEWRTWLALPRMEFPPVERMAAIFVVAATVAYGVLRGSAGKRFAPIVVDAKVVSASFGAPVLPVPAARVKAAAKSSRVREKKSPGLTGALRPLKDAVLPGVDPVEAKAIGSACHAQAKAYGFQACVLRTARETPHPIHLE